MHMNLRIVVVVLLVIGAAMAELPVSCLNVGAATTSRTAT